MGSYFILHRQCVYILLKITMLQKTIRIIDADKLYSCLPHIKYIHIFVFQNILKSDKMTNIAERHKYILDQLKKDGYVKVYELSNILGVSEVTIRKDLKQLESRKLLYRNYGSASQLTSIIQERHIDEKEKIYVNEKLRIAKFAQGLIAPQDKIIIASGTTLLALASEMMQHSSNITVITSSIKVSLALCQNPNIDILQLGGMMRKNAVSVIGNYAELTLDNFSCNKLFLGVDGLDLDYGLTTSNMDEAHINQKMIDVSQEIIVLTDSSKFLKRGFCKICNLDKIHHIVTDTNAPSYMVEQFEERGIKISLV